MEDSNRRSHDGRQDGRQAGRASCISIDGSAHLGAAEQHDVGLQEGHNTGGGAAAALRNIVKVARAAGALRCWRWQLAARQAQSLCPPTACPSKRSVPPRGDAWRSGLFQ